MRKDIHEYYRALGLSPGASPAEIKRAYRQLIQRWHPDHFKAGSLMQTTAEDLTKEINEAYEQLFKKQLYKKFARKAEPVRPATKSPFPPSPGGRRRAEETAASRPDPVWSAAAAGKTPRKRRSWGISRWPWIRLILGTGMIIVGVGIWNTLPRIDSSVPTSTELASATVREEPNAPAATPLPPAARVSAPAAPAANRADARKELYSVAPPRDRIEWVTGLRPIVMPRPTPEWDRLFEAASLLLKTFERGDSRARVLTVQGMPDDSGENVIRYGSSLVYFKDGLVTGWTDRHPRLRVRSMMSPSFDLLETFEAGSSRSDVERLQGLPSDSVFGAYFYGSSVVRFDRDRVTRWTEGSESLRTPLIQPRSWTGLNDLRAW